MENGSNSNNQPMLGGFYCQNCSKNRVSQQGDICYNCCTIHDFSKPERKPERIDPTEPVKQLDGKWPTNTWFQLRLLSVRWKELHNEELTIQSNL